MSDAPQVFQIREDGILSNKGRNMLPGGPSPIISRASSDFMSQGACVTEKVHLEIFFPSKGQSTLPAKQVCARCPVRLQCLAWALEGNDQYAILGGTTDAERYRMRRQGITSTNALVRDQLEELGRCRIGHLLYLDKAGRLRCRECESAHKKERDGGGERTHCREGHELRTEKSGKKRCPICDREGKIRRRRVQKALNIVEDETDPGTCSKGHPYYICSSGRKRCRTCETARSKERTYKIRAGEYTVGQPRTHCRHGHELHTETDGRRRCRVCQANKGQRDCGHPTYYDTANRLRCHTCDSNSQNDRPKGSQVCNFCRERKKKCLHKSRKIGFGNG